MRKFKPGFEDFINVKISVLNKGVGALATWRILRLRMEEMPSRYGG
jgi:hypothetical protein